ncbi:MAG: hypothetical protein IIT90_01265 [Clostridiales bacterium]|nr:hypothetical protein [Clostridiales bacterium]
MAEININPVSLKCKVCGGDIVNNYLAGTSYCANCGNRWSIADLYPDYAKYQRIIANITKANDIVESENKAASATEAKLLYKTSIIECTKFNDPISSDLVRICEEGQKKAELLAVYAKGKGYFDKGSYNSALSTLSKVKGFRNADAMIEICKEEIEKKRKRDIPWDIVFSLPLPAAVGLFFREVCHWPWAVCILLFLLGSAGLGYVLYRGGVIEIIIKILSFLAAGPVIVFSILEYAFHVPTWISVIAAIGAPIALFILFALTTEQLSAFTNKKN